MWVGLLGLALALRAYHLTGFVVNNDEGHWLLYALDNRLLFEPVRNSYPRPEVFFPLLISVPIKLLGPNELALRLCSVLAGSLSLLPLASLVFHLTRDRRAAVIAATFLAVLPLHVYFSAQGIPDTIALFFGLCSLNFLMRARQSNAAADFIWMGMFLALALLTKATALYCWGFMAVAGLFLFGDQHRRKFYAALALAAIPLVFLTVLIFLRSQTLSFFREPGVTSTLGFSFANLLLHFRYLIGFYEVLLPVATVGATLAVFRATRGSSTDRQLLVWLFPLANLVVTPFLRAGRVELLWLIPSLCLFTALALSSLRQSLVWLAAGAVVLLLLGRSLWGVSLPYPGRAKAATDYTTAVLDRPAGWPSRDAARWLVADTAREDAILITAYTFTDPLLLELEQARRMIPNGGKNWGLLRDPANRIKYIVFTQDYRAYAPSLARYADTHFTLAAAQFPNYAIYNCQKDGRFVAYADAYSSDDDNVQQGLKLIQLHELERAVEAFKKELAINPGQPVASANLALLYFQLGRDAEGITQCERNIRLGIEPAINYGVLGQLRERHGDLTGAQVAYEKSLTFEPQNPVTLQLLANLKSRLQSSR